MLLIVPAGCTAARHLSRKLSGSPYIIEAAFGQQQTLIAYYVAYRKFSIATLAFAPLAAEAISLDTIVLPIGAIDMPASLRC